MTVHDPFEDEPFEQFETIHKTSSRSAKKLNIQELRQRVKHRAVSYLSRREHSQVELKRKLIRAYNEQEFPDNDEFPSLEALIESILTDLSLNNWQSDQRFAMQIGKTKGERYGVARIKQTLNQQGLDKELIDATVAELAQSELQRAQTVWLKKFGTPPQNSADYAKQTRFMAYRGFSFDVIKKVLKGDYED